MGTIPLVGEPLALDLVNTVIQPPNGPEVDLLASPTTVDDWLAEERDRLPPLSGDIDLRAVRTLRGHIAAAVEAACQGTAPPATALEALTAAQRAAPAYRMLDWNGAGVTASRQRDSDATGTLLAVLAEAAVDLLTDPTVRKIRRCEGPRCRLLFLPAHPSRRWCSPTLCGNRVRVARYYERHQKPAT